MLKRVQTDKTQKIIPRDHTQELPRVRAARGTRRIAVALAGGILVVAGLGLTLFPGPGFPLILIGLTILSWEFHWARRLLFRARAKLARRTRRGKPRRR